MWPKDNQKQVSAAVRILQQKRDASARATHLMVENDSLITYEKAFEGQAAVKKFFTATFLERKKMSTKTSFKRIALVAVAALSLGGVVGVSSANAALTSGFATLTASPTVISTTTGVYCTQSLEGSATGAASCTGQVGGQVQVAYKAAGAVTYKIAVSGATIVGFTDAAVGDLTTSTTKTVKTNGLDYTSGLTFVSAAAGDQVEIQLSASAAGAASVTITTVNATSGATTTVETAPINWVASSTITPSTQYSTVVLAAGNNDTTTASATVSADKAAPASYANTALAASIKITVKDSNNNAMNAPTVTATVTGAGIAGLATTHAGIAASTKGRGVSLAATSGGVIYAGVYADGTAGTATITISSGGVTLSTKTVTFTGTAVTATATQNLKVAKAATQLGANPADDAGTTNDGTTVAKSVAFTVSVADSAKNNVQTSPAIKLVSSNSAVITVGSCTQWVAPDLGNYECSVSGASGALSGQSATVTFKVQNGTTDTTGVYSVVASALTFTIGGSISSTSIAFDAASYGAGAPVSIVASVKDSSGNAAYDQDAKLFDKTLVSSAALGTAAALPAGATNAAVVGGKVTFDGYYAPIYGGDFTVTGTTGTLTTTATVAALSATATADAGQAGSNAALALDAANAATDAANNAYDEAQNATQAASDALAAVTALAAQVKSLIASVKKLTAAVAKLKK